jgi:GNAT superfamily N-acetyltransferase
MSPAAPDAASSLGAGVARRWREIDPLLPSPDRGSPHCGAPLLVAGDGRLIATGRCEHWAGPPGSLDLSWGAARRFQLSAAVADPGVADGLGLLLSLWRDHLAGLPGTGDADTAAVVNWPSRDVDGVATLLRHGFDPLEVLAARTAPARSEVPDAAPLRAGDGLRIRRAGPADIDAVARLGMEIIRFDSRFTAVNERADSLDALRREAAGLVAGQAPWTWLAERDGYPVALLAAQRPEAAGWITPMTRLAPAAYLMLMFVEPAERGTGVGAALVGQFHREADAAGMAVILLHHAQLNPLSAPFWSRQGYRPLWTSYQALPAHPVRLFAAYFSTSSRSWPGSLSSGVWKNHDFRPNRAMSIRSRPATTMPTIDQRSSAGAFISDFTVSQVRKMADPSGSRPSVRKSHTPENTRRR